MNALQITAHVRENDSATLICPACGTAKPIMTKTFRYSHHSVKAQCRCQQVFTVLLNFRKNYRKQTSLSGTYQITGSKDPGGGIIHITNISRGGLAFTVSGRHNIKKDQELLLEFQLNDKNKTALKKQAVVVSVRQNTVGCAFRCHGELDKALGFYLQN
ncbi:PilZ domain-containing protein [Desulfobulbus oligotrophicus]|uniref:PilZ domain-containing protein n=1 Tax=Desulfobulbus oligotrophicus TaxID=1909699 RepID=A0A7T5VF37_9BACT|nr:PilZ domain-containing protein [Desulfobulbus oligotrophicus]QQG66748.1 PilZ domain-containing protein [Desulfobulbus oligotrophicus]